MANKIRLILVTLLSISTASATIINVPADSSTIQAGINGASEGDTVLVQPGTYVENINFNGKNIVVGSPFLVTGDTAYISQTTIDGDASGSVVSFFNGEDSTAVLSGLTLTNGSFSGGGIYCHSSNPSIENVTIRGNSSALWWQDGGGMWCYKADPRLVNVIITGNTSSRGGGIYCFRSSPSLENVTISGNTASKGGGVYTYDSGPNLENVTISGNTGYQGGGGIYCSNSTPTLTGVTINGNFSQHGEGGGIYSYYSSPSFDSENRCNIYLNHAERGNDLSAYDSLIITLVVDTFTVMNPTPYHAYPIDGFSFDILNAQIEQVDADLYVSLDGDNTNSGLSPSEPLQTIRFALSKISADSLHPRTLYLANGTYSPSMSGEAFPVYLPSYVSLSGESEEGVILDAEFQSDVIYLDHAQDISIANLTITGSWWGIRPDPDGRGIYCHSSSLKLVNVTVTGNARGGIFIYGSSVTVVNSIIWSDDIQGLYVEGYGDLEPSTITIAYSNIQGGFNGIYQDLSGEVNWLDGNIDADPMFVNTVSRDYHLQEGSPCINAGTAFFVLDGDTLVNLRPNDFTGSAPDMGAYESPYLIAVSESTLFPKQFALHQNYPNPFNPVSTIRYDLPQGSVVSLIVYDIIGREVARLVDGYMEPGYHQVQWDGREAASGIYIARLVTPEYRKSIKMVLLK
jgi:predicted outer membrane repeat protein